MSDLYSNLISGCCIDGYNLATSAREVHLFKNNREAGPYFAYWKIASTNHGPQITTWMGDVLASVVWMGKLHYSLNGSKRYNFRAEGIDGRMWSGTYYISSGDYVRMRPVKR